VERRAALEALDLDEVERIRTSHAAGQADLDNAPCEREALSVARQSFRLPAPTAWPPCPGADGRLHLTDR
jgi:hypothetical protein